MDNLRSKLIRLAYRKPELRKDLLPLLTKTAAPAKTEYGQTALNDELENLNNSNWELVDIYRDKQKTNYFTVEMKSRESGAPQISGSIKASSGDSYDVNLSVTVFDASEEDKKYIKDHMGQYASGKSAKASKGGILALVKQAIAFVEKVIAENPR